MNTIKGFAVVPVLAVVLLVMCSKKETDEAPLIRPVRCQIVSRSGSKMQRTFSGVSKAAMEVNLSFKVGGTVRSVKIKVGDHVTKGSVIASVDEHDYRLMYEQASVAFKNARIQMQSAKSAFERTAALYENSNISLQDYERVKSAYESARAQMQSRERSRQLAMRQLQYTTLVAPMDGVVAKVFVENNENVMPGQSVVEINSGDEIEVTVGIPETYISHVHEGDKATVSFSILEGQNFEGVISEVSYGINSMSSAYPVSIILSSPSDDIRPGMAAEAKIDFNSMDNGEPKITIPIHTVSEDQTGRFVYIVKKTEKDLGSIVKKSVQTGPFTGSGIVINEGLAPGEYLVTAGISKLAEGMTVRILN